MIDPRRFDLGRGKATTDGHQSVTAAIFWLKIRAGWKETVVNEVTHDTPDSIKSLMQRIAENGRRFQDHGPSPIETTCSSGWNSEETEQGNPAAGPLTSLTIGRE